MATDIIRKLKNPKTREYNIFKKEILSMNFMWKYLEHSTNPDADQEGFSNIPMYQHPIVASPDAKEEFLIPIVESKYADIAFQVIRQIFSYNEIEYNQIYRCVVNQIHYYDGRPSPPHVDHYNWDHKNCLIYLNSFADGEIDVYDENDSLQRYKPVEDDVVTFDGLYHSVHQPAPQERRVTVVITYS